MNKKIVAIMPIKMQNERLPGKNTMLLDGKPLLQYELDSLKCTDLADEIYVYCSSDEIKEYLPEGISFLKRPDFLDLPTSNFSEIFSEFIKEVEADIYVYAHATAPYIKAETMKECIKAVVSEEYDSAFCAVKIQDYLWKDGKPLNFDAEKIPRSQDLEPIYRETSGVYVFTADMFKKYHRRVGFRPFIKEVTYKEAVDINAKEDFDLAVSLIQADI